MVQTSTRKMNPEEAELIDKWIFVLLAANNNEGIRGRIRFIKDFFLVAKKFVPDLFEVSQFYPYHFGPYSTRFGVRVNELRNTGLIQAELVGKDWEYVLTEDGRQKATSASNDVAGDLSQSIQTIKVKNRDLSLRDLLKEIYLDYPEYAKRAIRKGEISRERVDLASLPQIDDGPGFVASADPEEREIDLKGKAARLFLHLISD